MSSKSKVMPAILATCGAVLVGIPMILYGIITLLVALLYTASHRETWFGPSDDQSNFRRTASAELWSLENEDAAIKHNFLSLHDGTQLHYLSPRQAPRSARTLIIYLHGFPDSSHVWARQLRGKQAPNTTAVALDLPGCGGSDDTKSYGPDQILSAIAEAIVLLKQIHLESGPRRKCILVGHDWGGVITFRLAAETHGLIDDIVVLNSVYPAHAAANIANRLSASAQHLHAWTRQLSDTDELRCAAGELRPVLAQLWKSNYIFLVVLPFPLARTMPSVTSALLKFCHALSHRSIPNASPLVQATSWAMSCGPSSAETTVMAGQSGGYGSSVRARALTFPAGDWDQRVRLYREKLSEGPWGTVSAALAPYYKPSDTSSNFLSRFQCPARIIYGMQDEALDPRIVLEGLEEFFMPGESARKDELIVKLPNDGHWAFTGDEGAAALEGVLREVVGESE